MKIACKFYYQNFEQWKEIVKYSWLFKLNFFNN